MFHERFDFFVHEYFSLEETPISDRLDDIIIGVYGLIGVAVIYLFRREMALCKSSFPFVILGFSAAFVSVLLDTTANQYDIITFFIQDKFLVRIVHGLCWTSEEVFKLLAEGMITDFLPECSD